MPAELAYIVFTNMEGLRDEIGPVSDWIAKLAVGVTTPEAEAKAVTTSMNVSLYKKGRS